MRYLKFSASAVLVVLLSTFAVSSASAASPTGHKHLTATVTSTDHIVVDWQATSGVSYYKVKTSSTADMSQDVKSYKVSKAHTDFTVDASTSRYAYAKPSSGNYVFVRVYAVKSNGKIGESPYKAVRLNPEPAPATAQQLTVATFNVRTAESEVAGHSWASRKDAVASRIRESGAAVVALQEAGAHSKDYRVIVTEGPGGKSKSRDYEWQFEQLRDAVGGSYQLATDQEYSAGDGKEGTRILYDTSKLRMLAQGDFAPSAVDKYLRFVPWALFQNVVTGEQFYFVAAHLDNRKDAPHSHRLYDLRVKQIGTVIDKVREFSRSGVQVVLAGDMNSNIYSVPNNGVDRKLIAAGFYDAYATPTNVNEFYVTYNAFGKSKRSASRTDYIMTFGRPDLRGSYYYKDWTAKSQGLYPSDHNMQTAVVPY